MSCSCRDHNSVCNEVIDERSSCSVWKSKEMNLNWCRTFHQRVKVVAVQDSFQFQYDVNSVVVDDLCNGTWRHSKQGNEVFAVSLSDVALYASIWSTG